MKLAKGIHAPTAGDTRTWRHWLRGQRTRPRDQGRTALALGSAAATLVPAALWAEVGAPERLAEAPTVIGPFWTLVVPLLLFAVSFLSAYALYRHFSAK